MAKQLDFELVLKILGLGEARDLQAAVQNLKKEFEKLDGLRKLDELFKSTDAAANLKKLNSEVSSLLDKLAKNRAAAEAAERAFALMQTAALKMNASFDLAKMRNEIDLVVGKSKTLVDVLLLAGKTKPDIDLSKLKGEIDLVAQKGKQLFDLLALKGKIKPDIDLSKLKLDIDLVTQKGKQMIDLFATAGKVKVDFNLGKIAEEAERAAVAGRNAAASFRRIKTESTDLEKAHNTHRTAVGSLVREYLFLRRAVFGLGLVTVGREILEVAKNFDKARQSISTVFGDGDAGKEFEFVRVQAERLGLNITELAKEYSKFSAAGKSLGLSQQLVRDNFLAVAEAGAKLSLSSEEIVGALTAIQQIASKGRLSMEELRQQLGDRLPGAISIAAKALGVTEARLFKLVEAGQVTSDLFLTKFPAALRASFGTDQTTRVETTTAALQRFKNALSETTDAALRAGALEAFTTVLKSLVSVLRSPETAKNLKAISEGIRDIVQFSRENSSALGTLLQAFIAFKALQGISAIISGATVAFAKLGTVLGPLFAGAPKAAQGVSAIGAAATQAVPKVAGLGLAVGSLAAALANPLVLVIAGLAAADLALFEALIAKLDRAREATQALAQAQRDAISQESIANGLSQQIRGLSDYKDVVVLTEKEIKSLSDEGINFYRDGAEGAKKLASLQMQLLTAEINQRQALIKMEELRTDQSESSRAQITLLKGEIELLTKKQEDATAKFDRFSEAVENASLKAGNAAKAFKALELRALTKDAQELVSAFDGIGLKTQSMEELLKKAIPKDFAEGATKAVQTLGLGFAFLQRQGIATAQVLSESIGKALDKLTGEQLLKFQESAKRAFGNSAQDAQALALITEGALKAAFKNLGLDAEFAGQKISRSFKEILSNFTAVAKNALVTGPQLKAALDASVAAAKTKEELIALRENVAKLGLDAGKMGETLRDSILRLEDAIRLVGARLDNALGDSFRRIGVVAKSELQAIAAQAKIDFNRIKESADFTVLEIEAAFRKMAEEVTKANGGIPPIEIKIKAVEFNAFDLIVKAAEVASTRVKKAIEQAIPLAETKAQLTALADAIRTSFELGKLSVDDFGKLITEVGFKLNEAIAKPVGALAAAAELLGVKTKEQMQAMADNAKAAFSAIAASGQFTTGELVKAAQQYLDAYKAANDGVIDAFDPVLARAVELVSQIDGATEALDRLKNKANELKTFETGSLKDKSLSELAQLLNDTVQAYRRIGITNVEQLQIVRDIQNEINSRQRKTTEDTTKAFNTAADRMGNAANQGGKGAPGPAATSGGGGQVNNFNFTGANLDVDAVKRKIVPVLADLSMRRR